ncbi:MAG: ABC transporter ATP-binding protein [Acidimicrobiales bacterium]
MSGLAVSNLSVTIGTTPILQDVSFTAPDGSVLAVLGPSGSGKSTLLRAIAGFVPASGTVELGRNDVTDVPPHRRGIGLMFQNHALFPHLSVTDNVAFGLVEAGWAPAERAARVDELLELVELPRFGHRSVSHLSGGEAQRVALARALAPRPSLLMLDEPLGSLDRRLREGLVDELASLLRTVGTTALYVTHDQEEAAVVADQLLLLEAGSVVAAGDAQSLWRSPVTPWIARFLGHPNVSDSAVIPITALTVAPDGMAAAVPDGVVATVLSARFVDGRWRSTVRLHESLNGLGGLAMETDKQLPIGGTVTIRVDQSQVHRFD